MKLPHNTQKGRFFYISNPMITSENIKQTNDTSSRDTKRKSLYNKRKSFFIHNVKSSFKMIETIPNNQLFVHHSRGGRPPFLKSHSHES